MQVVLLGDTLAVAEPRTDNVRRELLRQFRLTRAAQVVPQSRPRSQAGTFDDLLEPSSHVDGSPVTPLTGFVLQVGKNKSIRINRTLETAGRLLEDLIEVRPQLPEDRHNPSGLGRRSISGTVRMCGNCSATCGWV